MKGLKIAKTMLNMYGWLTMCTPLRREGKHLCTQSRTALAKLGVKYVTWLRERPSISKITRTPETCKKFILKMLKMQAHKYALICNSSISYQKTN